MWYRMEGNTRDCSCGGVAEKWVLFGGAKVLNQAYVCSTCHPHLADYVSRQPFIPRPSEHAGGTDEAAT